MRCHASDCDDPTGGPEPTANLHGYPAHPDCLPDDEPVALPPPRLGPPGKQVAAEHAERLRALADDGVRTAQLTLASKLRQLAQAAHDAAVELELAGPRDRVQSAVPGRYAAIREAATLLEAARQGAHRLREEATGRG